MPDASVVDGGVVDGGVVDGGVVDGGVVDGRVTDASVIDGSVPRNDVLAGSKLVAYGDVPLGNTSLTAAVLADVAFRGVQCRAARRWIPCGVPDGVGLNDSVTD